jgi:hypothetical protein
MTRDGDEGDTVGTTNNTMNKDEKSATDTASEKRQGLVPGDDRRARRIATGGGGIAKVVHDEAIEEAVKGIHG